ncbi:MAG: hypothetical protein RIC55_23330 [Pirellulaceae bacterium]
MNTFHPKHLARYTALAQLLLKYGRSDLVKASGLESQLLREEHANEPSQAADGEDAAGPEQFARDLEKLGPAYIKLGQLLSTRADLLPPEYLVALERLQDDVEPVPFEQIERTITSELGAFRNSTRSRWRPRRWDRCTAPNSATDARSSSRCNGRAFEPK